jgi:hypothetical protein
MKRTTDKIRLGIFSVLFALLMAVLLLVSQTQTSLNQIHRTLKEMQRDSSLQQPQIIVPLYTNDMPPPWITPQEGKDK